ncbi:MAG: Lrp/AsnC ligand binding domain-containing protein [Acidilobaceae archaeon]
MAGKIVAYILVNVLAGTEEEVRNEILNRFGGKVTEARITYGEFDIVVRVEADNMRVLEAIVSGIRSISGVERTVTLVAT